MASPSNSLRRGTSAARKARGFTLIEIAIVMALVVIVGGFALIVSMDSFRGYTYHTDRDLLIASLQHARSEAIGNTCIDGGVITCTGGVPHGVHIDTDASGNITDFVVFQIPTLTSSYDPNDATDATISASGSVKLDTSDPNDVTQVVFEPLSAQVSAPGTIVLKDQTGRTSTTTIGDEGQIFWTD